MMYQKDHSKARINTYEYTITPPAGGRVCVDVISAKEFEEEFAVEGEINKDAIIEELQYGSGYRETTHYQGDLGLVAGETDYVIYTYSEVDGYYAVKVTSFSIPTIDTPNNKQWIFNSSALDKAYYDEEDPNTASLTSSHLFDLGVAFTPEKQDILEVTTWVLASNWKEAYPEWYEEDENGWSSVCNGTSPAKVNPTDNTSGNIILTVNGEDGPVDLTIPYSDYNGETCKFNLTSLFTAFEIEGEGIVNASLATSEIEVPIL